MRSFALLSIFSLGACLSEEKQGQCVIDSASAVSDAMDATLFIWAASKRCGVSGEEGKCTVDVTSAVSSVNAVVNVILKVLDECHSLKVEHKECFIAASELSKNTAALAAASGDIASKCPAKDAHHSGHKMHVAPKILCTMNMKNTIQNLFKGIQAVKNLKEGCEETGHHKKKCAVESIEVAAAFIGMGEYMVGAVGECERAEFHSKHSTHDDICAEGSLALIHHTAEVAKASVQLSRKCKESLKQRVAPVVPPPATNTAWSSMVTKLYSGETDDVPDKPSMSMGLMILMPFSMVAAYYGGRYYVTRQSDYDRLVTVASDNEGEE